MVGVTSLGVDTTGAYSVIKSARVVGVAVWWSVTSTVGAYSDKPKAKVVGVTKRGANTTGT